EGHRITTKTANMSIEEQHQEHEKWLKLLREEDKTKYREKILNTEVYRVTTKTANMSIEEQHQEHEKWLELLREEDKTKYREKIREQTQKRVYSRIIDTLRLDYKESIHRDEYSIIERHISKMLDIDTNSNTHTIREELSNIYKCIHEINAIDDSTRWKTVKGSIETIIRSSRNSGSPEIIQEVHL